MASSDTGVIHQTWNPRKKRKSYVVAYIWMHQNTEFPFYCSDAVVSTVASQQKGPRFNFRSKCVCAEFARSRCVCVGSLE